MTFALSLLLWLPAPPQEPASAQVLARFQLGGQPAVVTREDVALEMAFHQRRLESGRTACEHLIQCALVRREAERRQLWPSADAVRELWNKLQQQLRAAGRDPTAEAVVRNSDEATLLADLAVTLAHEQIVRAELDLRPGEPVSRDMLSLWLQEARQRARIEDDPDKLPAGTAVRIDGDAVPLVDLGLLLVRTSDQAEQLRFVRQVVVLRALEALAQQHGITVSAADLEAEFAARKADAELDPRFGGMTFEQLLQAQGLTPGALRTSRVFRAQVLQSKLAAKLHPRAELAAAIELDRQAVLDQVGPRRRLAVIYSRALDEPNALVPRDFPAAMQHLEAARERLGNEPFAAVARDASDDPGSRVRGGDLGWLPRGAKNLPEPVLAAAFALAEDAVAGPVRGPDGCYLVKVLAIEPLPTDDQLIERLRKRHAELLPAELLRDAVVVRADGTPLDDAPEPAGAGK